jgi:hypothetical protein
VRVLLCEYSWGTYNVIVVRPVELIASLLSLRSKVCFLHVAHAALEEVSFTGGIAAKRVSIAGDGEPIDMWAKPMRCGGRIREATWRSCRNRGENKQGSSELDAFRPQVTDDDLYVIIESDRARELKFRASTRGCEVVQMHIYNRTS